MKSPYHLETAPSSRLQAWRRCCNKHDEVSVHLQVCRIWSSLTKRHRCRSLQAHRTEILAPQAFQPAMQKGLRPFKTDKPVRPNLESAGCRKAKVSREVALGSSAVQLLQDGISQAESITHRGKLTFWLYTRFGTEIRRYSIVGGTEPSADGF